MGVEHHTAAGDQNQLEQQILAKKRTGTWLVGSRQTWSSFRTGPLSNENVKTKTTCQIMMTWISIKTQTCRACILFSVRTRQVPQYKTDPASDCSICVIIISVNAIWKSKSSHKTRFPQLLSSSAGNVLVKRRNGVTVVLYPGLAM